MSAFGVLLRQRLRRDRLQLTLWIVGTALMAFAGYAGVSQSYATLADRQNILAAALANPVILMFRGLPSGTSEGAFLAFEVLPWLALLAALMSTFLAVRHTRGDEEAGRAELVWATPAGRRLPTIATIVHGILANVVLAALTTLALIPTGLPAGGSLLTGAAAASCGIAFLGIGLLAAQFMRTSRGANSLTVWVLVATFLIRGIGNAAGTPSDDLTSMTSAWPAWLSPSAGSSRPARTTPISSGRCCSGSVSGSRSPVPPSPCSRCATSMPVSSRSASAGSRHDRPSPRPTPWCGGSPPARSWAGRSEAPSRASSPPR